jgi:hypothetical protein
MHETRTGFALLVAFLAGCAVAAATRVDVASSAQAQAQSPAPTQGSMSPPWPRPVVRWDYLCLEAVHSGPIMERAKWAGQQGWEMVGSGNGTGQWNDVWCFKRPL